MIDKTFELSNGKTVARVTFSLPTDTKSESISLVGDFNDWDPRSHPLRQDKQGRWALSLDLELRRAYQFRYLLNSREWMCDTEADAYVYNPHGICNFVVVTDPGFRRSELA